MRSKRDTHAEHGIQVFGLFRDYGEQIDRQMGEQTRQPEGWSSRFPSRSFLEPEGDPPANRATTSVELGEYFPVVRAGLDIQ